MRRKIKEPISIQEIDAGIFSEWLENQTSALYGRQEMNVPCGECNACCRASLFIHIHPGETAALKSIPREILFLAPLYPAGHMLMGYDRHGCCPMLQNDACAIYPSRPVACRVFDCRILAASGLLQDDSMHRPIVMHARRWKFQFPTAQDRSLYEAVQSAAAFLMNHPEIFGGQIASGNSIQISVLAIKVYEVFLNGGVSAQVINETEIMQKIHEAFLRFEQHLSNS